ncbi:2246_t:CDS:2, partial [Cetraspora pellucida]
FAKAETDVPDNVPEFIFQCRCWLNGSFFTAFYSIVKFTHIWSSGQPLYRKILLQIQFIYNDVQLIFNWFSLVNFYLALFFLFQSTTSNPATDPFKGHEDKLFDAAQSLYLIIIVIVFICSMGNRPQGTKLIYTLCIVLFAIIMATMLYCSIYIIYLTVFKAVPPIDFRSTSSTKRDNTNTGNLNDEPEEANKVTIKINVIEKEDINALYNNIIDELKIKGHEEKQHRNALTKKDDYYRLFRTNLVLSWIFTNGLIIILFTSNTFSKYFSNQDYSGAYNSYLAF